MKVYPKTKPSGVEWLGDVPEHWSPVALKRYVRRYAGGTPDRNNEAYWEEGTIPWINSGAVNQRLITEPSAFITEEGYANSSARYVPENALVMALAGQGKTKGMVAQMGIVATCNQSMAAICPRPPIQARYLFWLLVSQYEHIRNMVGGEQRDGLNLEILGNIPCLIPSDDEQTDIASYLDRETGRIDELVGKKRELIERLKEKRIALISRTVTRGLPADLSPETLAKLEKIAGEKITFNPTLKSSGIEWIGDVPEHWAMKRLKHVLPRLYSGVSVNSENVPTQDDSPAVLKTSCVYGNRFRPEENKIVLENEWDRVSCSATKDSIIVSRMNTPELVGSCGYVDQDYQNLFLPDRLWIARFSKYKATHGKFAWYLIISDQICALTGSLATGTSGSMKNLSQEAFLNIQIAVPPLPEQRAISAYIDEETAKLDALVSKVETAIERLQEYRTALITAAVTGKINCLS